MKKLCSLIMTSLLLSVFSVENAHSATTVIEGSKNNTEQYLVLPEGFVIKDTPDQALLNYLNAKAYWHAPADAAYLPNEIKHDVDKKTLPEH